MAPEQWFELVERFAWLADPHVDERELMLKVRAEEDVLGDRQERDAAFTLLYCVRLLSQNDQRTSEHRVTLGVLGCRLDLLLQCQTGRVRVHSRLGTVAPECVSLGEDEAPQRAVIAECTRGQTQDSSACCASSSTQPRSW